MRDYPENRDAETRLNSRHAYYHRNKERINFEERAKRSEYSIECDNRIDQIVNLSLMSKEELTFILISETNKVRRNIISSMIRNKK